MKNIKINLQNIIGDKYPWLSFVDVVATTNQNAGAFVGQTIAGKVITSTMRVLLLAQTTTMENGIYINNERAEDMLIGGTAYGKIIFDTNLKTIWYSSAVDGDIIGTTAVSFVKPEIWQLRDFNNNTPTAGQALVYTGSVWQGSNIVNSVFGRTGTVVATSGDYSISQITNASTLANTANINLTSPQDRDILSYDTASSKYINVNYSIYKFSATVAINSTITAVVNTRYICNGNNIINFTYSGVYGDSIFIHAGLSGSQVQIVFPAGGFIQGNAGPITLNSPSGYIEFMYLGSSRWIAVDSYPTWYSGSTPYIVAQTNTGNIVDFNISNPTNGQILVYNSVNSKWANTTGVNSVFGRTGAVVATSGDYTIAQITNSSTLASTANVNITSPTNGQFLTYDTGTTKWINSTYTAPVSSVFGRTGTVVATSGDYTLSQIGTVNLNTPVQNDYLKFTSGAWRNVQNTMENISNTSLTNIDNYFMYYRSLNSRWESRAIYEEFIYTPLGGIVTATPGLHYIGTSGGGTVNLDINSFNLGDRIMLTSTGSTTITLNFSNGSFTCFVINSASPTTPNPQIIVQYSTIELLYYYAPSGSNRYFVILNINSSNSLASCTINAVKNSSISSISKIGDVVLTTPTTGDVMRYNGTNWVNSTVANMLNGTSTCAPTAELSFAGSTTLTLTTLNTYYKIAPTTTFLSNNTSFTTTAWSSPSNGTLSWDFPSNSRAFHVAVSMAVANSGINQNLQTGIYVNGVLNAASLQRQRFVNSNDAQMFSYHKVLVLNQNDTIEVYIRNITSGGTTLTIYNFNIVLMSCCSYSAST